MATTLGPRFIREDDVRAPAATITQLLVATDGSPSAEPALRAARDIAERCDASVAVLAVHESLPIVTPEVQLAASPEMEQEARSALRLQILAQLDHLAIDEDWPVEVVTGNPAAMIAKAAHAHDASLVIMGLGEHGLFERLLGDETVIKLLRLGAVPVLAVAPGFDDLPQRVVAATDFTASSARAAALATQLMDDEGVLTLAHVMPKDADAANYGPHSGFDGTIGRVFDLSISRIEPPRAGTIERRVLAGDPARALLELADSARAELIVAGSHGHGFLTRLMLGSVSQQLVRGARCSVLIAPPSGGNFLDEVPQLTTRFSSYEWAERLEEFTRRNAGRTATLEVIDPEIGAQVEERGFPFVGAAYDPRNAQVQIMVGNIAGRHLTRSIGGVTAVQVLRDRSGRDLILRVAHGRGQTLLTLERT
ncbi:MAG: universal stress protein [Gemmatimonadaceae bacterium]